ncbi:hypothetical protein Dsin_009548 [Dipteronia sinensis]|uniref:Reverse transcriptase zinc-binding domain-containing protein n=1 Tax=Dipteronia sinensis TaxID=43782 RepID=A0AAE0AQU0_9ROSI|nr:hypothetical protein Dsin_009548 [Dipteronia sinensis]
MPCSQGSLGLKDLGLLNNSILKKLTWKFMTFEGFTFSFLRERYLTQLCKSQGGIAISLVAYSLVWARSRDGQVSCKSAYSRMIRGSPQLPIEDCLSRGGFQLASRCSVCGVSSESSDHLFLQCPLSAALREAVFSFVQRLISTDSWSSFFS